MAVLIASLTMRTHMPLTLSTSFVNSSPDITCSSLFPSVLWQTTSFCLLYKNLRSSTPVPKESKLKKRKTSKYKVRKQNKIKLTPPNQSLNKILELGITWGIDRRWERLIYMHVAALNASIPDVDNLTLLSRSRKMHQSRRKTL